MVTKIVYTERQRIHHPYGFWSFAFDCMMVVVTGGLWAIWIFVREMRNR